jgi:hypothetical protein
MRQPTDRQTVRSALDDFQSGRHFRNVFLRRARQWGTLHSVPGSSKSQDL